MGTGIDTSGFKKLRQSLEKARVSDEFCKGLAKDLYRNENVGEEDEALMVTSLTEGDTATGFSKQASTEYTQSVLKNYESQLRRYRKVVFR